MLKTPFTHTPSHTVLVWALGIGLAGGALAADTDTGSRQQAPAASSQRDTSGRADAARMTGDMRASQIIGMRVKNLQDENLGKIEDLIVDTANQRVAYAVLSYGGMMGMGDKLFAYPISLFQAGANNKELVLNLDKDRLAKAPGFEKKHWPTWGNDKEAYREDVDRYFGPTVSPKAMPNQKLARASDLIGKKVTDRDGKKIGKVEDMVVNVSNAKVHYAVLDFDKAWSFNDKLIPLSMRSLIFPAPGSDNRDNVAVAVARDQIDPSAGFDKRHWPDLNDPKWQRELSASLERPVGAAGPRGEERDRDSGSMSSRDRSSTGSSSSGAGKSGGLE